MRRRHVLIAGAAVAAGAAGFGAAAWRGRAAGSSADTDIWSRQFETPAGGALLALAPLRGQPLLLNFWATWCPPCVSELPMIDQFQREHQARGWRVVGVAVDNREPVLGFLAKHPVSFPVGLAGVAGVALSRSLGNANGALPFSVVFGRNGDVVARKLGVIKPSDLADWTASAG